MSLSLARRDPARARRELVLTWGACVLILAGVRRLAALDPSGLLSGNLAGVAAFLFIVLPERAMRADGERWRDFGLPCSGLASAATWRAWGRGLAAALATCAVVFPVFLAGFAAYARVRPALPPGLAAWLAPYALPPSPRLRLPDGFAVRVAVQLLVVALPEELFYRGWMQRTWAESEPERGVRVLGARLGAGFLATQALFAAGHLVVLQPWRLATFFPGLLFGWLRERTGDVAAPVLVHASSNLFLAVLEASFYG